MLEIRNLKISYPGFELCADLSVEKGAKVALLGPSGAGKSTLLSAIAGFHDLDRGTIHLNGQSISDKSPGKRRIAMVFQDQNLFPHLSAFDNVALAVSSGLKLSKADRKAVESALNRVGLGDLSLRKPGQLSGGQQARVTLARVVLQECDLILLDEPFGALGPSLRSEMLKLVGKICAETGRGLLMVTHDPEDAQSLCPETILVAEGEASGPFSTKDILANPPKALSDYLSR